MSFISIGRGFRTCNAASRRNFLGKSRTHQSEALNVLCSMDFKEGRAGGGVWTHDIEQSEHLYTRRTELYRLKTWTLSEWQNKHLGRGLSRRDLRTARFISCLRRRMSSRSLYIECISIVLAHKKIFNKTFLGGSLFSERWTLTTSQAALSKYLLVQNDCVQEGGVTGHKTNLRFWIGTRLRCVRSILSSLMTKTLWW